MDELIPKIENWFEFLSVHQEMLEDSGRVDGYSRAISTKVEPGHVVLDLGTGTGLLALMAARAGASMVYAIESAGIIRLAQQIAERNGLGNRITFIHGDSREVRLPERVDVLVSEVIGHSVVDENMLDSIIDARRRFLRPESGRMIPECVEVKVVPVSDKETYDHMHFWKGRIAGFDYSPAWNKLTSTMFVEDFKKGSLLCRPKTVAKIDLYTVGAVDVSGRAVFQIHKQAITHGFALWFKGYLSRKPPIILSSGPNGNTNSWMSTYFPLREPMDLAPGDRLCFEFACYSSSADTVWEWTTSCLRGGKTITSVGHSTAAY